MEEEHGRPGCGSMRPAANALAVELAMTCDHPRAGADDEGVPGYA